MIYLLEDDSSIRELVVYTINSVGMQARGFASVAEFDRAMAQELPELALLDIMLPEEDGLSVLRRLRRKPETARLPVIMLTARGSEYDRVLGLELGADDYVTKPFDSKEVMARIKTVLRRVGNSPDETRQEVEYHNLYVSLTNYKLVVAGKQVDAPPKEIELLYHLAKNPNRVFTRDQLLDEIWGFKYFGDSRTVDVHIKRIREKLEGVSDRWAIRTVWGIGYKFETVE